MPDSVQASRLRSVGSAPETFVLVAGTQLDGIQDLDTTDGESDVESNTSAVSDETVIEKVRQNKAAAEDSTTKDIKHFNKIVTEINSEPLIKYVTMDTHHIINDFSTDWEMLTSCMYQK